jgi:hypothetical protein
VKIDRHPHPHLDPRQPRHGTQPGTNPPVFAWKPPASGGPYRLTVAHDPALRGVCLDQQDLREPAYLPEAAFDPGTYYWAWSAGGARSEILAFEILPRAVVLEVPPAATWLQRFPRAHPRLYVGPEDVPALRASRQGARAARWAELQAAAELLLDEPHETAEPPYLPDRNLDYDAYFSVWGPIMWDSRRFVKGAETLALAYLASGDARYGRAACRRMASISRWDPEGSSYIAHNDEAHMSVIWHGPKACDWAWDQFTEEERALVIDQFRRRGQITYQHMHDRGSYGVTRFDSHAGREIVFLAMIAFAFSEYIPEAQEWLDWLRPVLCGIWPIWAGDDGAWAEGPSYGLAYVRIMTMFATALVRGTGVDLYRRPFWRNHAAWRRACFPPYAEWMGFGDHTERWASTWRANADLVEIIDRESGAFAFADYVTTFRAEAERAGTPSERQMPDVDAQRYLAPTEPAGAAATPPDTSWAIQGGELLRVFPAAGWAAVRTDLRDPARDLAFIFRSSPYGAISHSHANNNDFILHVAGKVMAMPSGYYAGYASAHHAHWVWHTQSHNCLTLSGAPQLSRSHESRGAVEHVYEDGQLAYLRGNADPSYRLRATRCRRHVFYLKPDACYLLIDEFAAAPGVVSSVQWNVHSWNRFAVDDAARTFFLEREGSSVEGHFLYHQDAFTSLSEGWDPPPTATRDATQWFQQYHLRFTPVRLPERCNLAVLLCPGHAHLQRAEVRAERIGETEVAHIGDDLVLVNQGAGIVYQDLSSPALALLRIAGTVYTLDDGGLHAT